MKSNASSAPTNLADFDGLKQWIGFRCIVGSRAQGLATETSDTDRRGFYVAPAKLYWSLAGAPAQLEESQTEECYWEIEKFLKLALKVNPNVLECLYSPLIETATPFAHRVIAARHKFLSKAAYETFGGYAKSQLRRVENARKKTGTVRWKPLMHLLRLLLSGAFLLREGTLQVDVGTDRERLLAIKRGEVSWEKVDAWRVELLEDFEVAYSQTSLPEEPDFQAAEELLYQARLESL